MTLSFEDVFSDFLGCVTDFDIVNGDMQFVYLEMSEWLLKAFKKPYVRTLFSSSSIDDEIQLITFEMKVPTTDEEDLDFICDVLAKGMVVEWLAPQVRSKMFTSQFFGGKEQKWFAQSNHLNEVRTLYNETKKELRSLIGERDGITNSYLSE